MTEGGMTEVGPGEGERAGGFDDPAVEPGSRRAPPSPADGTDRAAGVGSAAAASGGETSGAAGRARPLALVAGWTCSGKTRFARALAGHLRPASAAVLSQDDYYRDTSHLTHAEKVLVNHDRPEALDLALFAEHLETLCSGGRVPRLAYDFASGARRAAGTLGPADFVIGEGVRVFRLSGVGERAALRVLLDGTPERLLARRIRRDTGERGYSEAETRRRFAEMALPAQREALAGAEAAADFVFPMDWGEAEVARAAVRLAGDTSPPGILPRRRAASRPSRPIRPAR